MRPVIAFRLRDSNDREMARGHDRNVTGSEEYLLDNQQVEAGQRFDALSVLFNPSTFRHTQAIGLMAGWRVWEVGAGSPSVPAWLAEQVGAGGHVPATDIDTTWLGEGGKGTGYEVLRHDVGAEPPPPGHFDLVHASLVLVHVPQRAQALAAMVAALKPGGWLLLEEADPGLQGFGLPGRVGPRTGAGQQAEVRLPHTAHPARRRPVLWTNPSPPPSKSRAQRRNVRRLLPDGRAGLHRARAGHC
jgi:SAM-dependent methyltransferase